MNLEQSPVARKMSLYNVLLYWDIFLATRLKYFLDYRSILFHFFKVLNSTRPSHDQRILLDLLKDCDYPSN